MRTKGFKFWRYGCQLTIPNFKEGTVTTATFKGTFDRRQLRKMVRKTLMGKFTVDQLDHIIDVYTVKLLPASIEQLVSMYEDTSDD